MDTTAKIGIMIAVIAVVIILLMVVMKSGNTTTTVNNGTGGSNDNASSTNGDAAAPPPTTDVSVTPSIRGVRYVLIETPSLIKNNVGNNHLNLAELYVYDDKGNIVSKGKKVTTNADYDLKRFKPEYLVDGDETTIMHNDWKNVAGTIFPTQTAKVDLGGNVNVTRVKIVNRPIERQRFNNSNIKLLDASGATLFTYNTGTSSSVSYDIATA
jgi:hypothetical protein